MSIYSKEYGSLEGIADTDIISGITKAAGSSSGITFNTRNKVESFVLVDYANTKGFIYRYDPRQPNKLLGFLNGTINYSNVDTTITITDNNVTIAPFTYSTAASTWCACVTYENVCTRQKLIEQEHANVRVVSVPRNTIFNVSVNGFPEEVYASYDGNGITITNVNPVNGMIYDDRCWDVTYSGYTERTDFYFIREQNSIRMNASWSSSDRTVFLTYTIRNED